MAVCFNDQKDEENFVRRTRNGPTRILREFEQQPEGKAMFKSKVISHELEKMKEIIFTIVQMMTAYL